MMFEDVRRESDRAIVDWALVRIREKDGVGGLPASRGSAEKDTGAL